MENLEVKQIEEQQTESGNASKEHEAALGGALLGVVIAFIICCIGTAALPVVIAYMLHNWTWLFLYPGFLLFIGLIGALK